MRRRDPDPHDPLGLKGRRKVRRRLAALAIGASLLVPVIVDTQQPIVGHQRRDLSFFKSDDGRDLILIAAASFYLISSSGTFTPDSTFNQFNNWIGCLGAGGGGCDTPGGGGGGGAWSQTNNYALVISNPYPLTVGVGGARGKPGVDGGDTYFGSSIYASCIAAAKGGKGGVATGGDVAGGLASQGIGTVKYDGGRGGDTPGMGGGAGGGAAGPDGPGGKGGTGPGPAGGGGGGGANGGQPGSSSTGMGGGLGGLGNKLGGRGGNGGGAPSLNGEAGQPGTNWYGVHGPGGGGGGGAGGYAAGSGVALGSGANGGQYGGGGGGAGARYHGNEPVGTGGTGAQGLIVVAWNLDIAFRHATTYRRRRV